MSLRIKNLLGILFLLSISMIPVRAWYLFQKNDQLVFEGGYQNPFRHSIIKNFMELGVAYSQPTTFFRIPGKRSMEVYYTFGPKKYAAASQFIAGISGSLYLFQKGDFSISATFGVYTKNNRGYISGAYFLFGEKIAVQYKYVELFYRHFSNDALELPTHSFNFIGLRFFKTF